MIDTKKTVEVLDSLMGCGKTTAIINWMKDNHHNKYIYVSPRLSEVVERIPSECPELDFQTPQGAKSNHMLQLLKDGKNIAATHALYQQLTEAHTDWVALQGYTLIIDEEVDFIDSYRKYNANDIATLKQEDFIDIDYLDGGRVIWQWDDIKPNTAYEALRNVCNLGMLYVTKSGSLENEDDPESHIKNEMLVTHIPPKLIDVADRVIILTYKYFGSVMDKFFSLRGYNSVPFTEVSLHKDSTEVKQQVSELIKIVETPSTKKVKRYNLTGFWYERTSTKQQIESVSKAIISVGRKCKSTSDNLMYTLPKDVVLPEGNRKARMKVDRYPPEECFLYSRCRATNDYSYKNTLIHAYNRYPNTAVERYLRDYQHPIDNNNFALAEMLQWIFRSAIREGKPINLSVLNHRMLELLVDWIEESTDRICKS